MILLIGGLGSIGERYQAVLRALNYKFKIWDAKGEEEESFDALLAETDRAIIATPTSMHTEYAHLLERHGIPYLCEKPISKNLSQIEPLRSSKIGFVVNNWEYIAWNYEIPNTIRYNFFRTGRDGLAWDCCQLLYIAEKYFAELSIETDSYFWRTEWNGARFPYAGIEESYAWMLEKFLNDDFPCLWSMEEGYQMSLAVDTWIKAVGEEHGREAQSLYFNPMQKQFAAFPTKNIPNDWR